MSTKSRDIVLGKFYHVYNRAVDKRTIFYTEKDYEYFINKALFFKDKTRVKILAYCVLPNHWHFLLKEPKTTRRVEIDPSGRLPQISLFLSLLSNSYTKYFNSHKDHSGRIFQGPFKCKAVDNDNYLQILINYINLNHLKHKIAKKPADWFYTSHNNYMNEAKFDLLDKDYMIDFNEYKKSIDSYIKILKSVDEEF